ncbi:antibiotic biosynthesis monooxygenase [Kurthia zopfii]|uniref:Heme oxygenase (Staphylobilin-producing) n=1 Tax=Kurthia zopfii TaxID=1650 RepID=A0A8B4QBT5_9BACL|nr:antibiotic biosynthesis monooxygenase [Kurthia zopfii]PWI23931.1 antibiotic biosynthesis monooxygenase [Kurthia zopfii]TDR44184.1 heme oxygenase (staphylobilin-producing) [Kurthia zopfii]GEK30838.1 antibiotic biosynthesis monooxygenase [Kurthia zopfii]STX10210.1 Heme-degrading monooxygenase isdG [Kurthia zopfii]
MIVQMRRFTVTEGNGHLMVEKFTKGGGLVEQQPGFIDKTVLEKKVRRGEEEVIMLVRWESEEAWKAWEKSPEHIAGHRENRGKPKPDHVLNVEVTMYEVK